MPDLDDQGVAWAQACQDEGSAGFCIRTLDDGSVRLIGLSLPPKLVARMLRSAANGYEAQVPPETVN
jgi:hypothetical protein